MWKNVLLFACLSVVAFSVLDRLVIRRRHEPLATERRIVSERAPVRVSAAAPPDRLPLVSTGELGHATQPTATDASGRSEQSSEDEVEPPPPPSAEDQFAYVNFTFTTEDHDGAWARDAERSLETALRSLAGPTSKIRFVECRRSLCKAETEHGDKAEFQRFLSESLLGNAYWKGDRMAMKEDSSDGSVTNVIFFAREGAELPVLN